MKLYIKSLALAALALGGTMAFTACTEDKVYDVDINDVPQASDYADNVVITVDQETNTAYFSFTGKGVYPVWIIDGKSYSSNFEFTRYYRKAGDYAVDVKIGNGNGISQGTITKTFHVDKTKMNGFGGYVYDSDFNLWTKAKREINSTYYAPGWGAVLNPEMSFDGETLNVKLATATSERLQAQIHLSTDICLNEGESFDGSFIFTATKDIEDVVLKIHPDGDNDDGHSFFCNQKINLKAGEPVTYWFSDLTAAVAMNNLWFTFDFGLNPDDFEVTVENFVLKSHANDDGTVLPEIITDPEPKWVALDSDENLFHGTTITPSFYYAPGWAQIADPAWTTDGNGAYTFTLPSATFEQWQTQCGMNTTIVIPDATVTYDFMCILKSTTTTPATVKLVESDETDKDPVVKHDGNFFCADQITLESGEEYKYWVTKKLPKQGTPMHAVTLMLDFGGNPEGTEVTVSNIILQVHHD